MTTATANGITIEYEVHGDPNDPTVLLVMGLGEQLTAWHDELCDDLVGRRFRVVRYDNRDVGLSQKFDDAGIPNVMGAVFSGKAPDPPYTLDDMAADGVALLDHLGIERAHVAGASMGGMISQTMAINHPDRLASLTSIMSTTGNPRLPAGKPEAYQALLAPPAAEPTPELVVERGLRIWNILAGRAYPTPDDVRARWILRDFERSYYPFGVARQLYSIVAHGDRTARLGELDLPTAVLHGSDDPLIPAACGEATAEAIAGATLRIVDGWGHDFPLALVETIADTITSVARP